VKEEKKKKNVFWLKSTGRMEYEEEKKEGETGDPL